MNQQKEIDEVLVACVAVRRAIKAGMDALLAINRSVAAIEDSVKWMEYDLRNEEDNDED